MICPRCKSAVCRRSRRQGIRDRIASAMNLLPWRCITCEARFYAGMVAMRFLPVVHCPNCGNLDLEQVGRDRVMGGWWTSLRRVLRFPAYRCDACRTRFFSVRRFRPVVPTAFPEFTAEAVPTPGRRPSTFTDPDAPAATEGGPVEPAAGTDAAPTAEDFTQPRST